MEQDELKEGVRKYGTPTYFFDLDVLKARIGQIKKKFGSDIGLCYAMKANPFLIKELDAYVDRFEVCSPGEYEICYETGISPDRIIVSGVNKTYASMDRIMELGDGSGIFTVESPEQYEILSRVCQSRRKHIKVLIRLSSGNQFGVDQRTYEKLAGQIAKDEMMELVGMHYYSGTQKKFGKLERELKEITEYTAHLADGCGIRTAELEYGPGLPVSYFEGDKPDDDEEMLGNLCFMLRDIKVYDKITIELGRFIAAGCGYYATSVVDIKNTDGHNYCIVDGGIHHINYYGQLMGMKRPHMKLLRTDEGENGTAESEWCIFGSLCTVNDVLIKDVRMPSLNFGDCLVFADCGAYSVTEGMALFLSRELPQIVFYSKDGGFKQVRGFVPTYRINSYEEN